MSPDIQKLKRLAEAADEALRTADGHRTQTEETFLYLYRDAASPATILALIEENERLKEACLALEMALSEAGDDYPGSAMQEWCVQQIERAHQIMRGPND